MRLVAANDPVNPGQADTGAEMLAQADLQRLRGETLIHMAGLAFSKHESNSGKLYLCSLSL